MVHDVIWVGSDATLDRFGAVEWSSDLYSAETVGDFAGVLAHAAGDDDPDIIVALTELIGLNTLAPARAHAWEGKTVIYGGDNPNCIG